MVENNGEKKTRSSKSKRSRRVPKSVRWHKNLTSASSNRGMNTLSCNFNCTEKLSSILMCQKGYASLAFYALFALFILAFIYALWKIVSANTSRSSQNRRPETPSKVNPTTKAPTWSAEDEEELRKFFPTMSNDNINSGTQQIVKPTSLPSTSTYNPPTVPMQDPPTQPEVQPPSRFKGSLFGEDAASQPYESNRQSPITGEDYIPPQWPPPTPTWQQLFGRQWSLRQRKPPLSMFRDNRMSGRYFNGRGRVAYGQNDDNIAMTNGHFRPHLKTPLLNGDDYSDKANDYSNSAKRHKDHNLKKIIQSHHKYRHNMHHHGKDDDGKHLHHEMSSDQEVLLGSRGKKSYTRSFISRPDRSDKHHSHKKSSGHPHSSYQEGFEESNSRDGGSHNRHHHQHEHMQKHHPHHHQQSHHNHFHQEHHHEIKKQHNHHQHVNNDLQTKHQHHHTLHRKHQQHRHAHKHVHRKAHKTAVDEDSEPRSKIPHHTKHNRKNKQRHNRIHTTKKRIHNAESKNVKHLHHILDYKHYVRYKKHHSVDEEVHGQWKGIKRKIKNCIKMKTFSASGKVLLTRARYQGKHLYTVLVCNVVRIRKHRKHSTRASYKKTQLCYKLYFVTKAVLQLKRKKESITGASEYDVDACRPSKARFHSVSFRGTLPNEHNQGKKLRKQLHRDHDSKKGSRHKKKTKKRGHTSKRARNKSKKTKTTKANGHSKKGKRRKYSLQGKSHKSKERHSKERNNSEDLFFNKLLNVLSIVNKNKASVNNSTPLSSLKSALQKMKKDKEAAQRKREKNHRKSSKKDTKKHPKKGAKVDITSPLYISKLLSKILPSVVSNVKSEIEGESGVKKIHQSTTTKATITTTKPTTPSTTPSTTTHSTTPPTTTHPPTTPTTKRTPKPTTKGKGIEDELKDILPFLLKKMQTTTPKPTTPKPTTQGKGKLIKDLLSRLGLAGLNLGAASKPTREVKADGNPSASRTSIEEKMEDLSAPPAANPSPIHPPPLSTDQTRNGLRKQSVLGNDPYSKHILCFGDSLTNGYYNHGHNFHPYSIRFKQLLNSNHQIRYDVVTSGKTGEMAHGSMSKRLPEVLGNSSRFDWVVILAGTNDVAHVKNFGDDDSFMNQLISIWSPKILKDIVTLHEDAYRYGSRTVLLTIPESAYEAWPQFKVLWLMRRKINQELRQFAASSQGRTILCDLAVQIPRHSLSPQMQKLFWNDHLHLNPYGYDKMGEDVYRCLKPYL